MSGGEEDEEGREDESTDPSDEWLAEDEEGEEAEAAYRRMSWDERMRLQLTFFLEREEKAKRLSHPQPHSDSDGSDTARIASSSPTTARARPRPSHQTPAGSAPNAGVPLSRGSARGPSQRRPPPPSFFT